MDTPTQVARHDADYKPGAWKEYTLQELGAWVALLAKRATHRSTFEKRDKDIRDARTYLAMMSAHLDEIATE